MKYALSCNFELCSFCIVTSMTSEGSRLVSALQAARLPRIRFHDLRHTAATLMLSHGVSALVVSKILGHSNPGVTLSVYAHSTTDMQAQAASVMDEIVMPIAISLPYVHPIAPDCTRAYFSTRLVTPTCTLGAAKHRLSAVSAKVGAKHFEPLSTDPEFGVSPCMASTALICGYAVTILGATQSTASTCSIACSPICDLSATALQLEEKGRLPHLAAELSVAPMRDNDSGSKPVFSQRSKIWATMPLSTPDCVLRLRSTCRH